MKKLLILTGVLLLANLMQAQKFFAKGADISWLPQMEATGYQFFNDLGEQEDCFKILKDHGINSVRLRTWVNPSDNKASGHCSKDETVALAVRAKQWGMKVMIDFHYSDSWADPGKQVKPKAWEGLKFPALKKALFDYTVDVMKALKKAGVEPEWVQLGNEIPTGMIYPEGHTDNWAQLAALINKGYDAVKKVSPKSKVMLHVDQGNNIPRFTKWFENASIHKAKFDMIGLSYYPFWLDGKPDYTENIDDLTTNMRQLAARYNKEVMVVEVGGEDFKVDNTYDMLIEVQKRVKSIPGGLGTGVFYWEPQGARSWSHYGLSCWGDDGRPTRALDAFLFEDATVNLSNPNTVEVNDAPVVLQLSDYKQFSHDVRKNLAVFDNNKQMNCQLDDLNKDGIPDELVFLADFKAGENRKFELRFVRDNERLSFPKEVYASLILKGDSGKWNFVNEVSSDKNNMYNQLHHHGVAFESDKIAYRIYFDNKSTVDVYGKKKYRLEIPETHWYPTDSQLLAGYGDDILLVSGWVGVGTVKGWNGTKATHIDVFDKRTHRIVSTGNIRTVVDSEVLGWAYEGKKINLKVRYILYASHRDAVAEVTTSEDIQNLATGVQQIGGGKLLKNDTLLGSWGSWYPQPDTVKYAKETAGLGLFLSSEFKGQQTDDGVNNLILVSLKKGETLRYHFIALAAKEEGQKVQNAEDFFLFLENWTKGLMQIRKN